MCAEAVDVGPRPTPWADRLLLSALAIVPLLLSSPGRVTADSRQYLYLDPGAFLARATSLWDPSIGAGTVPHQHLGFLWPMGPWFLIGDTAGLPVWVTQRFWLAAIAVTAGLGAVRLARVAGLERGPALIAGLIYQFTPFQLAFTARFSALLLPWAALPWLVVLAVRAVKERTWRAPLAFGLVAATAGAVNASSLALVMLAPASVVLVAAFRGGQSAAVLKATARLGVATIGASAWWLAGLLVEGRSGLPVLQLTENVDTVTAASHADDVVRGLGNWIFTSTDGAGTSIEQADAFAHSTPVRLATIALPAIAVAVLALTRRRDRALLAGLLAMATVVGVGAAPLGNSTPYGRLWQKFAESNSLGLSLRNTPRIVPVIVLVTAVAVAIGVQHLRRWQPLAAVGVVCLVATSFSSVAAHGYLSDDFDRPEDLPSYWVDLAHDLDAAGTEPTAAGSRVLEIPGSNFAAYDWGNAVEPVTPGLVKRPYLAREVLPAGGAGTANLLAALDRHLLDGTVDDVELAPLARLLGVGDIVIRGDLDHARFGLPDPSDLIRRFDATPPTGFSVTGRYGIDDQGDPILLRLTLDDPTPLVRFDQGPPVLLAGDGAGIVDAAAAGLIDGRRTVLTSATTDDVALADALDRGGEIVVTDTNRKQATTFFYTIVDDLGATERVDAREPDPTHYDVRFGPYSESDPSEQTVALLVGGTVDATMGGGPERPEHRGVFAFDGNPNTAWRPRAAPLGQAVQVRFDEPVAAAAVTILVADGPAAVTRVEITVDGASVDADLDERSRTAPGQTIALPVTTVSDLGVEVTAVDGVGEPGLADVRIGGATVDEVIRVPIALVTRIDGRAADHRLSYVLTRLRGNLVQSGRSPVEVALDREIELPVASQFDLTVEVRSAATADDACRDDLVSIDGDPVDVRLTAFVDGKATFGSCRPVSLDQGRHRITAAPKPDGSLDVDQLVLSTGPAPSSSGAREASKSTLGRRRATAEIKADRPFWFTLAQSANDGWHIEVDGGTVRTRSMIDGYADGWLIEPGADGLVRIELTWTPQRIVWVGMLITAFTLLSAAFVWLRRKPDPRGPVASSDASRHPDRPAPGWGLTLLTAAVWPVGWFFVAGASVAALALVALAARIATPAARVPLAVAAAGAVVASEMSDRPSLVLAGLSFALSEIVGAALTARRRPRTRPEESTAAATT